LGGDYSGHLMEQIIGRKLVGRDLSFVLSGSGVQIRTDF
jgi:hypothetical protein